MREREERGQGKGVERGEKGRREGREREIVREGDEKRKNKGEKGRKEM